MLAKLADIVAERNIHHVRVYRYGSATYDDANARDIDLLAVIPGKAKPTVMRFVHPDCSKDCALYIVSESTCLDDIRILASGGYYAHKFAFGCDLVLQSGTMRDMSAVYWRLEAGRLLPGPPAVLTSKALIRSVHSEMFRYRPTVGRALVKYIRDVVRQERLAAYVDKAIMPRRVMSSGPWSISRKERFTRTQEQALFRFWKEYNVHKPDREYMWSAQSLGKLSGSTRDVDVEVIQKYLSSDEM